MWVETMATHTKANAGGQGRAILTAITAHNPEGVYRSVEININMLITHLPQKQCTKVTSVQCMRLQCIVLIGTAVTDWQIFETVAYNEEKRLGRLQLIICKEIRILADSQNTHAKTAI